MLQAQAMQQMVGQKVQQDNLKSLFQTGSTYQQNYNSVAPQTTALARSGRSTTRLNRATFTEAGPWISSSSSRTVATTSPQPSLPLSTRWVCTLCSRWPRSCCPGTECKKRSSAAHGGPGFHMGKFLNFFMLLTFAYCFVAFYDGSIPGLGTSLKGFISGGTNSLVDYIGSDSTREIQNQSALPRANRAALSVFHRALSAALHLHRPDHAELSSPRSSRSSLPMARSAPRSLACWGRSSFRGWFLTRPISCSGDG